MSSSNGSDNGRVHYPFDRRFQKNLLILLARDPAFAAQVGDAVDPRYFSLQTYASIAEIILDHHEASGELPSRDSLLHELRRRAKKYGYEEDFLDQTKGVARTLYRLDLPTDPQYLREEAAAFGRSEAMKEALIEAKAELKADPRAESVMTKIVGTIRDASLIGTGGDTGIQVFDDFLDPAASRPAHEDPSLRVPTGLRLLDKVMRGGAGAGRLAIITGPTNIGKSHLLLNFAVHAAMNKFVTHVYVTEMNAWEVKCRILSRLTGCPIDDVERANQTYLKAATKVANRWPLADRYLYVERIMPGSPVTAIRSAVSRRTAKDGRSPQLIVIDAPDDLRSVGKTWYGDGDGGGSYYSFANIYTELINLGEDYQSALWCASHVNRSGQEARLQSLSMLADSIKKAQLAYFCGMLEEVWNSKGSAVPGRLKLHVAKNRGGKKGHRIQLKASLEKSLIQQREYKSDRAKKRRRAK